MTKYSYICKIGVQGGCKQKLQKGCASTCRVLYFEVQVSIFEIKDGERQNRKSREGVDRHKTAQMRVVEPSHNDKIGQYTYMYMYISCT